MGLVRRDLSGEKLGRWTVIEKAGPYLHNGKRKDWLYKCQCDRITTMEDLLLAHVSPEELGSLHAQLLIEEEIK